MKSPVVPLRSTTGYVLWPLRGRRFLRPSYVLRRLRGQRDGHATPSPLALFLRRTPTPILRSSTPVTHHAGADEHEQSDDATHDDAGR